MNTTNRLSVRADVNRAKAALIASPAKPKRTTASEPARLIQEHPVLALVGAVAAGFLVVTLKPGRIMLRQTFMAGASIMLRKAIFTYIRKS